MITEEKIAARIVEFIQEGIVEENVSISQETPFREAGIDSFSIIELVLLIENTFGIKIKEEDFLPENFTSAATLARCASRYI